MAPSPSEPSRIDCGTALMMSSESDDTNGISMMPMTSPAVITDERRVAEPQRLGEVVAQEPARR